MADRKANALLKGAASGDVKKIRELLAEGAALEAVDANRMTPVMLAAKGGHAEGFQTLVEAGANLDARALTDIDLLECAAEGGNVEIIQFLLDRGHPVEGHWQPRSKVAERMGHMTPLFLAAINGHVEAVRVLLRAGANREAKFDGQTALKNVQENIKYPLDNEVARLGQLQEVAALLAESPAGSESKAGRGVNASSEAGGDAVHREVERFAANARRPEHAQLRERLVALCGGSRPWQSMPDHGLLAANVIALTLKNCEQQSTLEELQQEARDAGGHLVLAEPWAPGENAELVLFPTGDKFAVVAAVGTEGANEGISNAQVIDWLRSLDGQNPFHLTHCNHESVGGAFVRGVKGAGHVAERIVDFCPSILGEEIEDVETLALVLKKSKSFYLRWD